MNTGTQLDNGIGDSPSTLKQPSKRIKVYQVVLLGLSMAIRGNYTAWSFVLITGFWQSIGALLIMASGYFCLTLCLAELTSAMPFSGGTYGLARVTLGNFPAFLVFAAETMEYVLYVAFSVGAIAQMITVLGSTDMKWRSAYFVAIYLSLIVIHSSPRQVYWSFNNLLSTFIMVMIVIYCVGVAPKYGDFNQNVTAQDHGPHDSQTFFQFFPAAAYFFVGLEILPFAANEVVGATKTIPRAIYLTFGISLVAGLSIMFCAVSVSGMKALTFEYVPLNAGYALLFGIDPIKCTVFPLIATYTGVLGYSFAYSRLLSAAQRSKISLSMPAQWFPAGTSQYLQPMLSGSLVGWAMLMWKTWTLVQDRMFENCAFICAFLSYIGIFVTYIAYRHQFATLSKHYISPLGVYGAAWGIVIFSAALISAVGFQKDDFKGLIMVLVLLGCFLAYYFFPVSGARKTQIHNSEEQAVLFIAYVMKANQLKRDRVRTAGKNKRAAAVSQKKKSVNTKSTVANGNSANNSTNAPTITVAPDLENQTAAPVKETEIVALHSQTVEESDKLAHQPPLPPENQIVGMEQFAQYHADLESGGLSPEAPGTPVRNKHGGTAVRGGFLSTSFLRSMWNSPYARVFPGQGSSNMAPHSRASSAYSDNQSEDGDSSESSDQRRRLDSYFSAMPESFVPRDLNFDEDILERYNTALEEFNTVRQRVQSKRSVDSQGNKVPGGGAEEKKAVAVPQAIAEERVLFEEKVDESGEADRALDDQLLSVSVRNNLEVV